MEDNKTFSNNWETITKKLKRDSCAFCGAQRTPMRFRADAVRSITDALNRLLLWIDFWAGSLQYMLTLHTGYTKAQLRMRLIQKKPYFCGTSFIKQQFYGLDFSVIVTLKMFCQFWYPTSEEYPFHRHFHRCFQEARGFSVTCLQSPECMCHLT